MKKILCLLLSLLMLFMCVACGATKNDAEDIGAIGEAPSKPSSPSDGSYGDDRDAGAKIEGEMDAVMDGFLAESPMSPSDAYVDSILPTEPSIPEIKPQSGLLTAGEWKDLDNIKFWQKVLNNNDWYTLMEQRNVFPVNIVTATVKDSNGNPCFNIPVYLKNGNDIIYSSVTDICGNAYLISNLYNTDKTAQNSYKLVCGNNEKDISTQLSQSYEFIIEETAINVEQLDLMLMIDTTGSMGDELEYLKVELENVINRISELDKALSINLSVNFYRDDGDEYIVRPFEFTSNIDIAIEQLREQKTDGGGDYPEAVHKAIDSMVNHQWRKNSIKLCFFVLDAPPHSEQEIAGINKNITDNILKASEKGIRIIPIASSGVNTETEFLLRTWAVMTGGTYTFLTDDSGIGNSHLEPTIGEYKVEQLNNLMVRIVGEYCGIKVDVQQQ